MAVIIESTPECDYGGEKKKRKRKSEKVKIIRQKDVFVGFSRTQLEN